MTLERITKGEYTPPSRLVANYPQALEAIVQRALDVDPDKRFQTAGDLCHELEALARALGMAIGDPAIVGTMHAFGRTGLTKSQRFARASSRVRTDPELIARIEAEAAAARDDLTPVVAMAHLPMPLSPVVAEGTPIDLRDVPQYVEEDLTVPVMSTPPHGGIAPLGVQYASALRPSTGTAKLLTKDYRALWFVVAVLAIAVGAMVALAVH
jgi:hypothetical protein